SLKVSPKKSYKVVKFIEKPSFVKAKKLLSDGSFFWNSGIFVFKARFLLSTLKRHMPFLYRGLTALPDIRHKGRFDAGLKKLYKAIKSKSLDYAIMEKSGSIRMIPSDFTWNDMGSFNSVARLLKKDADGNIIAGNHAGIDTKDCFIFSDTDCLAGTIGIKGITVVATPDAVLVCDNKKAGDIRKLLGKIRKRKKFLKFL
ncbi:MAG: sugar phosphate nucleotidyltransferase, partial [Candidatus Omnitrophota bacterium]|nr:sugar phosphate nucleotidyltransferase [Candidatus Omnitrophota bacterium]